MPVNGRDAGSISIRNRTFCGISNLVSRLRNVRALDTADHPHRGSKDTGALLYPCEICGKPFARSDVRKKHIATMHAGDDQESSEAK